jgi:hypothetical protein
MDGERLRIAVACSPASRTQGKRTTQPSCARLEREENPETPQEPRRPRDSPMRYPAYGTLDTARTTA